MTNADEVFISARQGDESAKCGRCAEAGGNRGQRDQRPGGGNFAVVAMPELRDQQRAMLPDKFHQGFVRPGQQQAVPI